MREFLIGEKFNVWKGFVRARVLGKNGQVLERFNERKGLINIKRKKGLMKERFNERKF